LINISIRTVFVTSLESVCGNVAEPVLDLFDGVFHHLDRKSVFYLSLEVAAFVLAHFTDHAAILQSSTFRMKLLLFPCHFSCPAFCVSGCVAYSGFRSADESAVKTAISRRASHTVTVVFAAYRQRPA
jgi:hypothetical protein